jgi:hypothetical protein
MISDFTEDHANSFGESPDARYAALCGETGREEA